MASLRKLSLSAALAASLALQPAPANALNVIVTDPPALNWDLVVNALSDGKLDAGDLVGVGFDALWSAAGDAIADTQICREAYAHHYSNTNTGPFTFYITVTHQGDPPVVYSQPIRVVPHGNTLVVGVAKGDGGYARVFRCGGDGAAQPQRDDPSAAALLTADEPPPSGEGVLTEAMRESRGGAEIFTFDTLHGQVVVYLPDDIAPGDSISGTVVVEPEGEDQTQRRANADTLRGYAVDIAGAPTRVGDGLIRFVAPVADRVVVSLLRNAGGAMVPVSAPVVASSVSRWTTYTPVSGVNVTGPPRVFALEFDPPAVIQAGRPGAITGPFDGDASNTQVAVNGAPCPILAESPRQVVMMAPEAPIGPVNVQVREGGNTAQGVANNVSVALSAGRTTLARGERTNVTLRVAGLDGIQTPLQVRMWASSTVNLQGGNLQTIAINPGAADNAGVYVEDFRLRVLAAGPFDVTAGLQPTWCAASTTLETIGERNYRQALQNVRSAMQRAEDAMRALTAARQAYDDAMGDFGNAHMDHLTALYADRDNPSSQSAAAVRQTNEAREQAERRAQDARTRMYQAEQQYRDAQHEQEEASRQYREAIGGATAEERATVDAQERASQQGCAGAGR